MATNSASTAASDAAGTRDVEGPARQLWQVPTFFLGVAALLGVVLARPFLPHDPRRQLEHDLTSARHLLARPDGDPAAVVDLARRALEAAEQFPDRIGEAALLLGSAYTRLAEKAPAAEAAEHWRTARKYMEEAERRGVPENERGLLEYRLGKVGFYLHDDPQGVVNRLAGAADLPEKEDNGEGYVLLTQAYLRLDPPDLHKALEVNKKLRNVFGVSEEVLAEARLQGGELLLRLHSPAEARKTLALVGDQAPPRVLARARVLHARICEEEGGPARLQEAIKLYQEALADGREPLPDRARVLYDLGVCHQQAAGAQEISRDAQRCWDECLRVSEGEEGQAAALALAEAYLRDPKPDRVADMLARAVQKVRAPADWSNSLIDLTRARGLFERAVEALRKAGRCDLALQVSGSYQRLALPGRAEALRAETASAWARAREEQAGQEKDNVAQQEEEVAARELMAQAGAAYLEAADASPLPTQKAEHLWQSANHYFICQDFARAAAGLERFLKTEYSGRHAEGWFLLGEAHRLRGDVRAAEGAYRKGITYTDPPPFAYRSRYQLALFKIQRGELDKAKDDLEQNLTLLRQHTDAETKEKTLFTLADLFYRQGNYREVVRKLEESLGGGTGEGSAAPREAGAFPPTPEGTRAHYQLADSYYQLAVNEQNALQRARLPDEGELHEKERRRWLGNAAAEFKALGDLLTREERQGHLSLEEEVQVPFLLARCLLDDSDPKGALEIYKQQAKRYPNRPECVKALSGCVSCYMVLGDVVMIRQSLEEIRGLLGCLEEGPRKEFEDWVNKCTRSLDDLKPKDTPMPAEGTR
jgi:tetratricopeptide (TPR) repeat protein